MNKFILLTCISLIALSFESLGMENTIREEEDILVGFSPKKRKLKSMEPRLHSEPQLGVRDKSVENPGQEVFPDNDQEEEKTVYYSAPSSTLQKIESSSKFTAKQKASSGKNQREDKNLRVSAPSPIRQKTQPPTKKNLSAYHSMHPGFALYCQTGCWGPYSPRAHLGHLGDLSASSDASPFNTRGTTFYISDTSSLTPLPGDFDWNTLSSNKSKIIQ